MQKIIDFKEFDNLEKGPIRRSLFRNGACILFHQANGFSGAKVNLNFLAGSMFETPDQEGISHLIEHLMFKEVNSGLVKDLEFFGAEINAYTYKENVCFELSCLGAKLEILLPRFLNLFSKLEFTDEQLEKEKAVVLQELIDDKDDHETQALEFVFEKNFNSGLGHPVGGIAKNVKKFSKREILRFYKKYYRPERMILTIVSGEGNFEKLRSISQENFDLRTCADKKPFRIKANAVERKLNHVKCLKRKKIESEILMLSFNGPTVSSKNYYTYIVLDELLFEGMSSLFFKKFREEKALVYGLGSSINSFAKAGNYIMTFNVQEKNIGAVETGINDVLREICSKGLLENDLEKIKERIIDSWKIAFDSIDERAEFISENEIYQQHHIDVHKIKTMVGEVSEKKIINLIKNIYFNSDHTKLRILKKKV